MKVENIHERVLPNPIEQVGLLLDSLSSASDRLWPFESWPAMKFDRVLGVGAKGGHGPIRYVVKEYEPGRCVCCEFTRPTGFHGFHQFHLIPISSSETIIRHVIRMNVKGTAIISWPAFFHPLHDALIADSFDKAVRQLGLEVEKSQWSAWVRTLRFILRKKSHRTTM
jgi:hypothetical protein